MSDVLDTVWDIYDDILTTTDNAPLFCSQCKTDEHVSSNSGERTCTNCGLVLAAEYNDSCYNNKFEYNFVPKRQVKGVDAERIRRWHLYTSEEKGNYRASSYVEELCVKLGIPPSVIPVVVDTVAMVMKKIKEVYGTKRAKVKDSIIVVCISCVAKDFGMDVTQLEICKKLNVSVKYLSKAETMLIELYNAGKLKKNYSTGLLRDPYEHILFLLKRHNLEVSDRIKMVCKKVIHYCENNDILPSQSPMVLGTICLYYVLQKCECDIDLGTFSSVFNLSSVTLSKGVSTLNLAKLM
ncbi:hypothetical protein EB118_15980 [bacterium]|nr:hypothetical protein [bacterium]NDD83077.1 hypothetical protein [bacterium]NDG31553.1 hypothetical protein [bacterium]